MRKLDSYLELGLLGMSRGGQLSWFNGHFGAALLAGYYLYKEHKLPEYVLEGIERTGEHYREMYPDWFVPLEKEESDSALLELVLSGLAKNTEQLTASGHGLALGVLALKALHDAPHMRTKSVIAGIVQMLERTAEDRPDRYWGIDNYLELSIEEDRGIPTYQSTLDMAKQAFAELHLVAPDQIIDGKKYFFRGELEHGITHAQALKELDRLGYTDLAKAGMKNHRFQMFLNRQKPHFIEEKQVRTPAFSTILAPEYWEKRYDDPHALKVPYAAWDLLRFVPSQERAVSEYDTCKILSLMQ
ncbi:hypothetical protein [Risungbinella massiliensis]|uniref:hypothetical protein n=1 Tax=Risungbinella massiliensis TaxID=1329796 RepID=UPI0005CBF579|nr:hypothetical protein [Risungbinella massiliensis]